MEIQELEKLCDKDGYKILQYNSSKDVVLVDQTGYKYNTTVGSIKIGNSHNILQHNRFALENLKLNVSLKSGGTFQILSDEYVNCKTPIKCRCTLHDDTFVYKNPELLVKSKIPCRRCAAIARGKKFRTSEAIIRDFVNDHGGIYDHIDILDDTTIVYFYCIKHTKDGLISSRWDVLSRRKNVCRKCSGRDLTTQDYINDVAKLHPDTEILDEYKNHMNYIPCRCKVCGFEWSVRAGQLRAERIRGCPKCGREIARAKRTKSLDQFVSELHSVNEDLEVIGEYNGTHSFIRCRCKIHDRIFESMPCNLLNGTATCPACSRKMSKMERSVGAILNELGISHISQYRFDDCRGEKFALPFDYYLPDYNVAIEYDGAQHFEPIDYFGGIEQYELRKQHDRIKDEYCIEHNIVLIRIPYYESKNLREYIITQFNHYNICT